jgi:hypothetical protein
MAMVMGLSVAGMAAAVHAHPPRPTRLAKPAARKGRLLLITDLACKVSVDSKPVATLPAGGRATVEVEPGEHLVGAVGADGANWRMVVKVGRERVIVKIPLGTAPCAVARPCSPSPQRKATVPSAPR